MPIVKAATEAEYWEVRRAAIRDLARIWKDDPQTLSILKERAREDPEAFVRQAAVQELARGWKDDPDTLPILKERAREEQDGYHRLTAIQELVRAWKDDPGTIKIIETLRNPIRRRTSAVQQAAPSAATWQR